VSAHWLTRGSSFVQAAHKPETIHDFGGFPRELHQFQYPAPGSPFFASALAAQVQAIEPTTEWGLDHGAWTVLCHLFPQHNIPCFELSINYSRPLAYHISLARELQFLREKGVLIIGSGNIVHNLQASIPNLTSGQENFGYEWAQEFDAWSTSLIFEKKVEALLQFEQAPGGRYAVPTPDHYIPMLYSLALAHPDEEVHMTYEQLVYGGISMRCFEVR
jgi:4,5-DOPA dioxygenase extradiol